MFLAKREIEYSVLTKSVLKKKSVPTRWNKLLSFVVNDKPLNALHSRTVSTSTGRTMMKYEL